jgi:hypothetical protein
LSVFKRALSFAGGLRSRGKPYCLAIVFCRLSSVKKTATRLSLIVLRGFFCPAKKTHPLLKETSPALLCYQRGQGSGAKQNLSQESRL